MAATVAINTYFAFGSNGSTTTEVDRSSYFKGINFPRETEAVETTTFGDANRDFLPGLKGKTFSHEGNWDSTIDTHLDGIEDNSDVVNFEYAPDGNSSGNIQYAGTMFVTSYETSTSVGEVKTFSVTFQITGTVTRSTIA